MSKTYKLKPGAQRRVWIEWEYPSIADFKTSEAQDAAAQETCRLLNKMLDRLSGEKDCSTVFWSEQGKEFCVGGVAGYVTCADNGHWFNLEFFGRE